MTIEEMKGAYSFGKDTIKELQDAGDTVPNSTINRLLNIADMIIEFYEDRLSEV